MVRVGAVLVGGCRRVVRSNCVGVVVERESLQRRIRRGSGIGIRHRRHHQMMKAS